jgi:imidazolonepropionase
MSSHLVRGIAELVTNDPALGDGSPLGLMADAAFVVEGGRGGGVGAAGGAPAGAGRGAAR